MIYRTYDSWKAHNPADEELGSVPQPGQDDDERFGGIFIGGFDTTADNRTVAEDREKGGRNACA